MSGHGAPSPAPQRSASTGPNGSLPTPTTAMVNGVGGGSVPAGASGVASGSGTAPSGQMSQQNLNQIVIDYLAKKGYTKTEATLRAESSNQEVPRDLDPRPVPTGPPKYAAAYRALSHWVDESLEVYKPELERVLWPMFVNCYLKLVALFYKNEAERFMSREAGNRERFQKERGDDLRKLERITLPEHLNDDNIGKLYLENKYRLVITTPAFDHLMQFLESLGNDGFKLLIPILESQFDLRQVDRASDDRFSFASMILKAREGQDMPGEDEGIPGHRPGNAISSTDPSVGNTLAALKLGKLQMDPETEGDVRADLADLDLQMPPAPGQPSYVSTHELVNIKQEDDDEGPTRAEIPYPPSRARDVAMEVQRIRENRDRFKIETRTGGIGPGISACMYTFHNTKDSITCLDFSGDNELIAAGTSESYIRVWSMNGKAIETNDNLKPRSSIRLIGHSGVVYAVSFAPSIATPPNADIAPNTKWLLSSSQDGTIRLWNLDLFECIVTYKGHVGPVWSMQWGPQGHYFVTGGADKLARIWSTDKPRQLRILAGHDSDVEVVCWHPNSAYVFTAGYDRTVRMWAMSNGQPVRMFTGHTNNITALACSRNGKILASADDGGSIMLWDLGPGRLLKRMRGHGKGGIWSLSWSVESTVLVSGGADNTVRVWDVAGPPKAEATQKLPGEAGKTDGPGPAAGVSMGGPGKKKKDAVITADQISAFPTKNTTVYKVKFTNMNLVLAGGAFLP